MLGDMPEQEVLEPRHRVSTTLVLSLAALAAALVAISGHHGLTALTTAAALAGLVPWALVAGGVHVPLPVFAAISLLCGGVMVITDLNPGGIFPVMVALVWITRAGGNWWLQAVVLAVAVALMVVATIREGSADETGLVYFVGGLGIGWVSGLMLRRQEALTLELQAMNELRVEHAAAAERTRIARDVHDVVAHSLTVVMLHLTGARRALAKDLARADEALARAESVGRDSLDSIRQVMGLLREPSSGLDVPVPGAVDLPTLLDGYRAGGLTVEAVLDPLSDLDATSGLVVYRVVQESLTNVLRHAAGSTCVVTVRANDGAVEVDVVNGRGIRVGEASSGARIGLGVRGMSERVRALGGHLEAGPRSDGGWRVHARVPCFVGGERPGSPAADGATIPSEDGWPQPSIP